MTSLLITVLSSSYLVLIILYLSKLKYVYSIKIGCDINDENCCWQTAFKIEGFDGIWTSLHGFFQTFEKPDSAFKNYRIIEIIDSDGNNIELPQEGYIRVSKIDIEKDIAYISTKDLSNKFNNGKGFKFGEFQGGLEKKHLIISKASGWKLNIRLFQLDGGAELFGEQLRFPKELNARYELFSGYKNLGIPDLSSMVVTNTSEKLFGGDSGSPIFYEDTVIAMAQASFEDKRSWGIIFNPNLLNEYNQLNAEQKKKLNQAYKKYRNINNHSILKCDYDTLRIPRKLEGNNLCFWVKNEIDTMLLCRNYPVIEDKEINNYKYIKVIPKIINFYLNTNYAEDLEKAYRILISHEKDYPEKYRKVRKDMEKFDLSLSYLNTAYLYHVFKDEESTPRRLDSLQKFSQQLFEKFDQKNPTKKERNKWRNQGFDSYNEINNLYDLINAITKFPSPIDPTVIVPVILKDSICKQWRRNGDSLYNRGEMRAALLKYLEVKNACINLAPIERINEIKSQVKQDSLIAIMAPYIQNYANKKFKNYLNYYKLPLMEFLIKLDNESVNITVNYGQSDTDFRINSLYYSFPPGKYFYSGSNKALEIINSIFVELDSVFSIIIDKKTYKLEVIGHSDGLKFMGNLTYDESDFQGINIESIKICSKYALDDCESLRFMRLADSDRKNKALAYLRALHAKTVLEDEIKFLNEKKDEIYFINHEEKGGFYRKVEVNLSFKLIKTNKK